MVFAGIPGEGIGAPSGFSDETFVQSIFGHFAFNYMVGGAEAMSVFSKSILPVSKLIINNTIELNTVKDRIIGVPASFRIM